MNNPSPPTDSRGPLVGAILLLALVWLILCRPWIWGDAVVPFDSKAEFYPLLSFVSQSIRGGESPCWNPFIFSGYPTCSDPQSMVFSPIALGLMLVRNNASMRWFDMVELAHLLLGAVGMLLLCVRLRWGILPGLMGALVYMFGGSASARMQHVPIIYAYGYVPFALLALHMALETNRLRWAVCCGVLTAIMAAHQVQVSYLFSWVLLGYCIYKALSAESLLEFLTTRWRVLLVTAVTTCLVLAIPIYLTLQFLPLSTREQIPYEVAAINSQSPITFLTLFVHDFFGGANIAGYFGAGDITETYLYIGVLPITLIVVFGIPTGVLFERRFRYFLAAGVLAGLYALGRFTPFFKFVHTWVPGVDLFRRPPDATFVINMVLALATAHLLDRLLSLERIRLRIPLLLIELGALGWLFWQGFAYAAEQGKSVPASTVTLLYAAIAIALLYAIRLVHSEPLRRGLVLACVALQALDMGVHNAPTRLNADVIENSSLFATGRIPTDPLAPMFARELSLEKFPDGPYRIDITYASALWANAPALFRIQSTQGYSPIHIKLYDQVAGSQVTANDPRPFTPMLPTYGGPMLNLLGARYVASSKTLTELSSRTDMSQFRFLVEEWGIKVWENPSAFPRAQAATQIYLEQNLDRAIARGPAASVDYRSTVVLDHVPNTLQNFSAASGTATPLTGAGDATVRVLSYKNTEVVLDVRSTRDAIVTLNDVYYPYWRVYVDNQERELLQANYLFRGVHVKPGERRVVFRFEPFSASAFKKTWRGRE